MIKKYIRNLLYGRKVLQPFLLRLRRATLLAMNYGGDPHPERSGESWTIRYLANKYHDGAVLDVGANIGTYSTLLASSFPVNAPIHSFEPSPTAFAKLQEATKTLSNVRIWHLGLSDSNTKSLLFTNKPSSGLGSLYHRRLDHRNIDMSQTEPIHLARLDEWAEQEHIVRIAFLKIDVEGHELNVLHGAQRLLDSGAINTIQFEFGGCNIDSRIFWQDFWYLLHPRYRISRIVRDGLIEIKGYDERDETFTMTNYLAELRDLKKA